MSKATRNGRAKPRSSKRVTKAVREREATPEELAEAERRFEEDMKRMPPDEWTVMRIALRQSRKRWLLARAKKAGCKNPSEYVRAVIDEHAEEVEAPWGRLNPENQRNGKKKR